MCTFYLDTKGSLWVLLVMITVVETTSFINSAKKLLSDKDRGDLITFLAANPAEGEIMPRTGGLRKQRYASKEGKGKSGGSRVIYFYCNDKMPLFVMAVYEKSRQDNLTHEQEKVFYNLVKQLKKEYGQ